MYTLRGPNYATEVINKYGRRIDIFCSVCYHQVNRHTHFKLLTCTVLK